MSSPPDRTPGVPHPTNTVHYACFDCRVSFKQPGSSNWDVAVPERPFLCPNCKAPMRRMGRYFKAPPRRDLRGWRETIRLYRDGERFETSRPST